MEITKKHIYAIDFIILVGTLIAIIGIIGYAKPLVIYPVDNLVTNNNSVLFEFQKADLILLDDNPNFTSPEKIYAKDNLVINLKPGTYYWKVQGALNSDLRTLTILSEVDLKLKENGSNYEVVNSGTEKLNVSVYDKNTLVGNMILDPSESGSANGDKVVGGMYGK